jgi:hypothetical protein
MAAPYVEHCALADKSHMITNVILVVREPGVAALCGCAKCDMREIRVQVVDLLSVSVAVVHVCTRFALVPQFLTYGIFPASMERPQLAFTLDLLNQAESFTMDGFMPMHQFESASSRFRVEIGSLGDEITPSTAKQSLQLALHRYRALKSALNRWAVGNRSACCPACDKVVVVI